MPRGPSPLHSKLKQNEFYCVKCRKRVTVPADNICVKQYANKRVGRKISMLKGECKKCGTGVNKIFADAKLSAMKAKYGAC